MIPQQTQPQFFNPQFGSPNNVLDYSFNIRDPVSVDEHHQFVQKFGPGANSLPAEGKNLLLSDFTECVNIDPAAVEEWSERRQKCIRTLMCAYCLCCVIVVGGFIAATVALQAMDDTGKFMVTTLYPLILVFVCVFGCCIFCYMRRLHNLSAQIQTEWQSKLLQALKQKMNGWKTRYHNLTFTIVYPRIEKKIMSTSNHGVREVIVAKWCHVRVTVGPCPTGGDEPVFATTYDVNAPVQQQQPLMMPVQQQQQQPLMMPMQQQATTAIVNGQQVMIVPMQQAPVQQMQMQQIPSGSEDPPQYTHQ